MELSLLPLLQIQRDLYQLPLGRDRFQAYIRTLTNMTDDLVLPLGSMNPMGKPHGAALLDTLLALDAEAIASAALASAAPRLAAIAGKLQLALVVTDDAHGGWTNRYFSEMALRFESQRNLARGWAVAPIWTSEDWPATAIRETALATIYRAAYALRHGPARSLRQMMAQEGLAAAFAGASQPALDPDDLDYTRQVLAPYLDATDYPTLLASLYGDQAARAVGYPPLGLSPHAGLALARADALHAAPEAALLG